MARGEVAAARAESTDTGSGGRGQEEEDATFEAFCQRYLLRTEYFLQTQCPDRGLAQDAAQEAFITARAKWDQIRHFDKPEAWIYKTALHKLWMLRRQQRDVPVGIDEIEPERPAEPADAGEARELLWAWLRRLPQRQAQVFWLSGRDFTDLEIAQTLGIAYNTVRTYKREARRQLRQFAREAGFVTPAGKGRA